MKTSSRRVAVMNNRLFHGSFQDGGVYKIIFYFAGRLFPSSPHPEQVWVSVNLSQSYLCLSP